MCYYNILNIIADFLCSPFFQISKIDDNQNYTPLSQSDEENTDCDYEVLE